MSDTELTRSRVRHAVRRLSIPARIGKAAARRALAPIAFDPHGGTLGQTVAAVIARLDQGGTRSALEAWDAATRETGKKAG